MDFEQTGQGCTCSACARTSPRRTHRRAVRLLAGPGGEHPCTSGSSLASEQGVNEPFRRCGDTNGLGGSIRQAEISDERSRFAVFMRSNLYGRLKVRTVMCPPPRSPVREGEVAARFIDFRPRECAALSTEARSRVPRPPPAHRPHCRDVPSSVPNCAFSQGEEGCGDEAQSVCAITRLLNSRSKSLELRGNCSPDIGSSMKNP